MQTLRIKSCVNEVKWQLFFLKTVIFKLFGLKIECFLVREIFKNATC